MRITLPDFLFERAFTFFGKFCIMKNGSCTTGCGSVWLECTAGGREVAGSNPVIPTDYPGGYACLYCRIEVAGFIYIPKLSS